jgi:hypothetical protein
MSKPHIGDFIFIESGLLTLFFTTHCTARVVFSW